MHAEVVFTTRPELTGDLGMVATTHWLASAAGMSVIERGGNAVDAAVTAGFVLQVVEPHMNGLGGDVPIIVAEPGRQPEVYCGQGTLPQAATIEHYLDLGLSLVPGTGLLAAVVPGAFGAWTLLLEERGTWRLRDVLEPAIGYARKGFPLLGSAVEVIRSVERLFREEWPTSAATYLSSGVPGTGERFNNPVLADTYVRIVTEAESRSASREGQLQAARDVFYRGFVAEAIDAHSARPVMDSSGRRHRGLLSAADLAGWQPTVEAPVSVDYGELAVYKTGPWGQGPVLLQQLQLLSGYDLASTEHLSTEWIHTVVECSKLAYADREAWYGDPAVVDVPIDVLLDRTYADERRQQVGDTASRDLRPGSPGGRAPVLPSAPSEGVHPAAAGAGEPVAGATNGDTCHIDVVDRNGLMVSATPSGGWLQSSPVIARLGFALGSRGQMSRLEAGLASSMVGGSRPRTTLSPGIATREGWPCLAFGTPGGDQQDQWALGFLLAHLHHGLALQAAIDAPTFHSLHFPSSFYPRDCAPGEMVVEARVQAGVIAGLRARGHGVQVEADWAFSRMCAVSRDRRTGFLSAAASPRGGQCYAVGR